MIGCSGCYAEIAYLQLATSRKNMNDIHHFVRVDFCRFKAFQKFTLHLRNFNILVGPNNSGKSTILAAFRILAAGMRKATSRKPQVVPGPRGDRLGYIVDLSGVSVAEENLFFNYDDSEPASVCFHLSNKGELTLFCAKHGTCYLFADAEDGSPSTPSVFRRQFNCPVGFVPILGPVDHREPLFKEETARLALFNYTAARNFRNIWYHYSDKFTAFRELLRDTWPGMDIELPKVDVSFDKPVLHMFCPEERIPREIFWAGFGFQVWCQMLTHLVQSSDKALFLIDEPDIYLHSDLQRQLLGLLRNLGPDILIATHSTEIITEAEADDIVMIDKKKRRARRIKHPSELAEVFSALGSNINPILTQLAKTRRAVFVEGKDFQIISRFARKLSFNAVASRSDFAVVSVEGFNPERIHNLIKGIETTLGCKIDSAAVLDRDYRSQAECDTLVEGCKAFCRIAVIHECKEIENFLLVPEAIDRAADRKVVDQKKRTGKKQQYRAFASKTLEDFASDIKTHVTSRYLAVRRKYDRSRSSHLDETTSNEAALEELDDLWSDDVMRLKVIPGKDALSYINRCLQDLYSVSVTPTSIIDAMHKNEIPESMCDLVGILADFGKAPIV